MWYFKLLKGSERPTAPLYGPFKTRSDALQAWEQCRLDVQQRASEGHLERYWDQESGGWIDGKLRMKYRAGYSDQEGLVVYLDGIIFFENDGEFD